MSDRIKGLRLGLLKQVEKCKQMDADLQAKGKDASEEEHKAFGQALSEAKRLREEIQNLQFLDETERDLTEPDEAKGRKTWDSHGGASARKVRPRWGRVKHFYRDTRAESEEAAYDFGIWAAAAFGDPSSEFVQKARQACFDRGIKLRKEGGGEVKTMTETINTAGGVLVPVEFDGDFIDNRETYGVARRHLRTTPMRGDKKQIAKKDTGVTAYFQGDAGAATASEQGWSSVELSAQKLITLTRLSSELYEDAIVNLGDELMYDVNWAFAEKEDDCCFNGDATSTYGGIVGLRTVLKDLYTAAGGVGLIVGSGSTYATLVRGDFHKVVGALPEYADGNAAWFCSKFFWASVMVPITLASGGATREETEQGPRKTFLGYPVVVSQKMPKTTASAQVCCLLGDLRRSSRFGDRRQTVLKMSEHRYIDTDEVALQGTERFDIKHHSYGDATNAGPVVGLITA